MFKLFSYMLFFFLKQAFQIYYVSLTISKASYLVLDINIEKEQYIPIEGFSG